MSRNRFWGTPIPMWISDDGQEVRIISSIKELEEATGVSPITDLHRDSIDHLTIPSKQGKGTLKRIDEVFDCWFESGSMPYAQVSRVPRAPPPSRRARRPSALCPMAPSAIRRARCMSGVDLPSSQSARRH